MATSDIGGFSEPQGLPYKLHFALYDLITNIFNYFFKLYIHTLKIPAEHNIMIDTAFLLLGMSLVKCYN